MEQSFIAQKLDIHLLLPEIHNTFNIFIRAKYHQVPLKYIHRYRLRLATGDAEGVVSGGRGSFYARFSGEFSYRPGYHPLQIRRTTVYLEITVAGQLNSFNSSKQDLSKRKRIVCCYQVV